MNGIINLLINSMFPVKCVCCGEPDENKAVCEKCCRQITAESVCECGICGFTPDLCSCKKILYADEVFYKYFYRGEKIKRAVSRYKKANLQCLNEFFAKDMFTLLQKSDRINVKDVDFVTNVPRKKYSVRYFGYDQSMNLAKIIAEYCGVPYELFLQVPSDYTEQKYLKGNERAINVKNQFKPIKKASREFIAGKKILLVDDVVTTGATLSECARVIRNMGAEKIYALCIASTYQTQMVYKSNLSNR